MPEDMTKPDPEAQTASAADGEQPAVDTRATSQEKSDTSKPHKKKRVGPWLFLLLVFIGLPAAWLLSPPEFRKQAGELLNAGKAQLQTIQVTRPTSPPMIDKQDQTAEGIAQVEAMSGDDSGAIEAPRNASGEEPGTSVELAAPASLESTSRTVDSAELLQEEINRLQGKLNDMQAEREQLTQQLKTSRVIELRVWLGLLASADMRLSQRVEMWSYLASLPSLDESEQKQAREITRTLQLNVTQLADLRKKLKQLGKDIPEKTQADIIPKPENPYLAWLLSAFHLRPAPSTDEMQDIDLKKQLLDIEHALSIEDWPEEGTWRQLLKAVRDKLSDNPRLSKSMDDIRGGIDSSRKTASDWRKAL